MKSIQRLRIDKICTILFSEDKYIEEKIRRLLKADEESQVIVPIYFEDYLNSIDEYFMRNKFRDHFYSRDLFAFEGPLKKDLYFFGRTDLIHEIVNRHISNENSGLFGLRRTGKTSLIHGIQRALETSGKSSIIIDCQNTSFHMKRWYEALHYIIQILNKHVITDKRKKINLKNENEYTEKKASECFQEEIEKIYRVNSEKNILIIFDEIENITFNVSTSKHWEKGYDFIYFWQTLRSLYQSLNSVFSYLIVGTNPMCIETPLIDGKDNPLFMSLKSQYIPQFSVDETKEMVTRLGGFMGLEFKDTLFGKLQ